ncbi:hypothetical protein FEM03_23560 [Phragmitibacter flavus]|uniref:Uncharacterized protein n=1 Tax=Phragmitibacter flavus TaxID=2576071 RepID=A0A5R8K7G7_9BACT|nr:AAA family ATPase [Phragmitibacter flavus]TLD68297.1 hypothetical protein FEM03_23560 [Phragmitibacter flavus]
MTTSLPDITSEIRQRANSRGTLATIQTVATVNAPPDFSPALVSAKAFQFLPLPERLKLLGEWMREGDLGFLFAPRGAGKSWLAMFIGNAIAENCQLGEWTAGNAARPVCYFDAEMNLPDLQERFCKIGITGESFHLLSNELLFDHELPSVNIADPSHQAALGNLLPDGSFFVIDNLSTSQTGMKENDNDAFDAIRDWLLALRHRHITTMIVHHAGRNGEMRGASRREDMAHWIIKLQDASEDGAANKSFATSFSKCRNCRPNEAPPLKWTLSDQGDTIAVTCTVHNGPDALLGHIREGVVSASELAELLAVSAGTVSKWAKKLMDRGLIQKSGRDYKAIDSPYE